VAIRSKSAALTLANAGKTKKPKITKEGNFRMHSLLSLLSFQTATFAKNCLFVHHLLSAI
jgi:hypothetical protein